MWIQTPRSFLTRWMDKRHPRNHGLGAVLMQMLPCVAAEVGRREDKVVVALREVIRYGLLPEQAWKRRVDPIVSSFWLP